MIVFKIIKDAYVLKYIEGNPAPAQQLKIALSRTVLPALTTGNPTLALWDTHSLLCPLASPHQSAAHPKVSKC